MDLGCCESMSPCKRTSRALPVALYKTQRPSPFLLYQEKAVAASSEVQERRGLPRKNKNPALKYALFLVFSANALRH
jgi:hypothetical protein